VEVALQTIAFAATSLGRGFGGSFKGRRDGIGDEWCRDSSPGERADKKTLESTLIGVTLSI
jgi:hypothetical protein